ncbi:MAG: Gfo/Idh/MocA family oxidoreductase [Bacteroidales bacterium]|jgi:predicted dehydrogenase|nr:Gfo/Idh/MocA family oxidoreductase [Bacteroidales bacterium]MDD2264289.1 Gfo/Idh/MocA family oxidoreductase [Bacteroidales bacterium]MDD2831523.1 Gfo/Idh/MocA family oxidoreductase [Bacteroidales bacterium]MDD3208517.1 Gfo/Idh/MocA family oxidoreductase [Bacteroidales bacterium]MDD3697070.1 Gfo/Idh/MocA family oxidoreductase [Bacteroidales bacterium]
MPTHPKIKAGIIGFGRMGEMYLRQMLKSHQWEILAICDTDPDALAIAANLVSSDTILTTDEQVVFADPGISVLVLSTLADSRKRHLFKAVEHHKHVITEKPLGSSIEEEYAVLDKLQHSNIMATVNLPLRNAWYHKTIKEFIATGEIGDLAIIRVCHMTPGMAPGEGHWAEGPLFHDCGMHYVDIARWYAQSEFRTWNAQAIRMWNYEEPWWLQAHGTFENGIVFDVTQGHVYGQLAKDLTHNGYVDLIGTKGIARMSHDFVTATVELHGMTKTHLIRKPFGDKNLDVLCDLFARSLACGILDPSLPAVRDAVIASEYAWKFLEDAARHDMPVRGDLQTLREIRERRNDKRIGYGLLRKRKKIR